MTHRARLAWFLVAVLLSTLAAPAYAERCVVDVVLLNQHRRVAGPVSAECTPSGWERINPAAYFHTRPFGNWGVAFSFHSAVDKTRNGYQFSGWKAMGDWLQWNSCTAEFEAPDQRYYNDNNFHTQRAWPDVVNVSHSLNEYLVIPRGVSCDAADKMVIRNVQMKIHELDRLGDDTPVATLPYGDVKVPYECSDPWVCYGKSKWVEPQPGALANVYAQLRIVVHLRKASY